jgi:hypothetical protein
MTARDPVTIPIARHITVRVRVSGRTRWRVQLWCAMKLIALAAWIVGFRIQFERDDGA